MKSETKFHRRVITRIESDMRDCIQNDKKFEVE